MKRVLSLLLVLLLVGCVNPTLSSNQQKELPSKINIDGFMLKDSPIKSTNLDDYLFRSDVKYVDLRPYNNILKEGFIAGFEFVPYYEMIGHYQNTKVLFKMNGTGAEKGSFTPNYIESVDVLKTIFPEDKVIFAISEEGSECTYLFNLLSQYGYDNSKLYNIGGFSNNAGFDLAYSKLDNPKYLVSGNEFIQSIYGVTVKYPFMDELTPIK